MKKILFFILISLVCIVNAGGAVRGANTSVREKSGAITAAQKNTRSITSRNAIKTTVKPRSAKSVSVLGMRSTQKQTNNATRTPTSSRSVKPVKSVTARATTNVSPSETRTGAAYEQCKTAFFTCMDQFCMLKNDNFKRCSCNDRVFDFQETLETYQNASDKLTEFSDNLDVVGLTAQQATAMKTATDGENALTDDKSVSKQLLQAIMNSIRGGDTQVGGKYKDLNSITVSGDLSYAYGMEDSAQIIASYNGANLYSATFPKCRNAVRQDCNDASLQRAINAYLMAIEQDCNTVESALQAQQKSLIAATHENSALLDLARVENRRNHNSDDVSVCLVNVEKAIQSEEVCGAEYHKCLDYGQFIDITTGAPLTGVVDFYKLGELLTFKSDTDIQNQKLSSIQNNQKFVQFFENKTKKFAQDSLDKCREDSDYVWKQYLDRALLDIYYAQQDKVKTIQQSCLDLVAKCYDNQNISIKNAMANLSGDSEILLKPAAINLTNKMCSAYIESCNAMFDGDIIKTYIAQKDSSDLTTACRAVAQQCFDKFGGTGYNNFYYTQSGLFTTGRALDWFTLYDENKNIVSPCAKQVVETSGCKDIIEDVFGGFDKYTTTDTDKIVYSATSRDDKTRKIRPTGTASEVYYKILDNLKNNCDGLGGYFVDYQYAEQYGYQPDNFCKIDSENPDSPFYIHDFATSERSLTYWYHFIHQENVCPLNYGIDVDTQSWGMCSCWENGGRRSKNGQIATCRPILPTLYANSSDNDAICTNAMLCKSSYGSDENTPQLCSGSRSLTSASTWCQQTITSSLGQVCPMTYVTTETDSDIIKCAKDDGTTAIDAVYSGVPYHKIITSE